MDRIDLPEDFKLWGYSLSELRQMRDYWESTHYSAVQGKKECTDGSRACPDCGNRLVHARYDCEPAPKPDACEKPKHWPLGCFDALEWAKEFCKVTGFKDVEWVHTWFANAIMTGYDEHARRARQGYSPTANK